MMESVEENREKDREIGKGKLVLSQSLFGTLYRLFYFCTASSLIKRWKVKRKREKEKNMEKERKTCWVASIICTLPLL